MLRWVARWSLWQLPPLALALVLVVDLTAAVLPWTIPGQITRADLGLAALLASLVGAYIGYCALSVGWRRARTDQHLGRPPVINVNLVGAWTFAAAILLPPVLTFGFIILVALARWPRALDAQTFQPHLHRYIYNQANVVLSATGAYLVSLSLLPPWAQLAGSSVVYLTINLGLVVTPVALIGRFPDALPFIRSSMLAMQIGIVGIGVGQVLLARVYAPIIWMSLPCAIGVQYVSQRAVPMTLRSATSPRRLLSAKAWHAIAETVVGSCEEASILRVTGPDVNAVAMVARQLAGCETLGRMHGPGLAILLAGCPAPEAESLVQRLQSALTARGFLADIAIASKPRDGRALGDLLAACRSAMGSSDAA